MSNVVIFFVPVGATQKDIDEALREHFASTETGQNRKQPGQTEPVSAEESPLWTWFLPNPRR